VVQGPGRLTSSDRSSGWNHNTHYHPLVLAEVPLGARRALDVGCGEGELAHELAGVVPQVVGLDRHLPSLAAARAADRRVSWVRGDITRNPFRSGSFDLVTAVASLHHVDGGTALRTMADLLRPGGRLVVIGLARSRLPRDIPREVAAVVAHRAYLLTRRMRQVAAPICWPPPYTYDELHALATDVLPGVRFRRHVLWRCSLVWEKPAEL
jgi:SAM-dependent methyltransferase